MKSQSFAPRAGSYVAPYSRLFLLAALGLLFVGTLLTRRNAAAAVKSTFTAQQILDRSAPICTALVPDHRELRMSVDYMPVDCIQLRLHGRWDVSCTDVSGQEVASIQWEDGTGALLIAETPPQPRSRAQPLLGTPQQALASARSWLVRLGYCKGTRLPDLSCRQRLATQWVVVCRFVDHEVVLHIDEYNGVLTYARVTSPCSFRK